MNVGIAALTGLLFILGVSRQGTIFSGTRFRTYYYDVKRVEAYGTSFAAQNSGPLECSSLKALLLDHINSNYVVTSESRHASDPRIPLVSSQYTQNAL